MPWRLDERHGKRDRGRRRRSPPLDRRHPSIDDIAPIAGRQKTRPPSRAGFLNWLRELDLNQRPSGYEPDELPGCSIPRQSVEPAS